MSILIYTLIVIATVFFMEFVAWSAHKYLMHGWLWVWHADHHMPHHHKHGFFEKNDLFFLINRDMIAVDGMNHVKITIHEAIGWI